MVTADYVSVDHIAPLIIVHANASSSSELPNLVYDAKKVVNATTVGLVSLGSADNPSAFFVRGSVYYDVQVIRSTGAAIAAGNDVLDAAIVDLTK